jgi:hypothetical protein
MVSDLRLLPQVILPSYLRTLYYNLEFSSNGHALCSLLMILLVVGIILREICNNNSKKNTHNHKSTFTNKRLTSIKAGNIILYELLEFLLAYCNPHSPL